MKRLITLTVAVVALASNVAFAQDQTPPPGIPGAFAIHAEIGSTFDFEGAAFGGGVSYVWLSNNHLGRALELTGGLLFHSSSEVDSDADSDGTMYDEETSLRLASFSVNGLLNYYPGAGRAFFIGGAGFGAFSVDWQEFQKPADDPNQRLPYDDEEGTFAGMSFTVGGGYAFKNMMEMRLEAPVYMFFGAENVTLLPTLVAKVQYSFM